MLTISSFEAQLTDSKLAPTLIERNLKLTPNDSTSLIDTTLYYQLIRSLVYLIIAHLDIVYFVHIMSYFLSTPRTTLFTIVL